MNEAPTQISLNTTGLPENSPGAVVGTISVTDPDAGDTHTYVSLGDGRFRMVGDQLQLKPGVSVNFEETATIDLQITVADAAGRQRTQLVSIPILDVNERPTGIELSNAFVLERSAGAGVGELTTLDPDAGSQFTYTVSDSRFEVVNSQFKLKAGEQLIADDEPTVKLFVTVTDNGDLKFTQPFDITVVAGTVPPPTISGPTVGVPGQMLTYVFSAEGLTGSQFDFDINWGDGTRQTIHGPSGVSVTHIFAVTGTLNIVVTATDAIGSTTPSGQRSISLTTALLQNSILYVGGTRGGDTITFTPLETTGKRLKAMLGTQRLGVFRPAKIVVYGNSGNDKISVNSKKIKGKLTYVNVPTRILGGAGNDTLSVAGNKGANVLLGGAGKDQLTGSRARDILIGGQGADTIRGGGNEDILVAGSTRYDSDLPALDQLLAKWNGKGKYATRRNALLTASSPGPTLNKTTVFDDAAVDKLFGEAGQDWFLASTVKAQRKKDQVTKVKAETLTQLKPT